MALNLSVVEAINLREIHLRLRLSILQFKWKNSFAVLSYLSIGSYGNFFYKMRLTFSKVNPANIEHKNNIKWSLKIKIFWTIWCGFLNVDGLAHALWPLRSVRQNEWCKKVIYIYIWNPRELRIPNLFFQKFNLRHYQCIIVPKYFFRSFFSIFSMN